MKVNFTSFSLKACDLANVRSVDLHPLIQVMKPEQTPQSANNNLCHTDNHVVKIKIKQMTLPFAVDTFWLHSYSSCVVYMMS